MPPSRFKSGSIVDAFHADAKNEQKTRPATILQDHEDVLIVTFGFTDAPRDGSDLAGSIRGGVPPENLANDTHFYVSETRAISISDVKRPRGQCRTKDFLTIGSRCEPRIRELAAAILREKERYGAVVRDKIKQLGGGTTPGEGILGPLADRAGMARRTLFDFVQEKGYLSEKERLTLLDVLEAELLAKSSTSREAAHAEHPDTRLKV